MAKKKSFVRKIKRYGILTRKENSISKIKRAITEFTEKGYQILGMKKDIIFSAPEEKEVVKITFEVIYRGKLKARKLNENIQRKEII